MKYNFLCDSCSYTKTVECKISEHAHIDKTCEKCQKGMVQVLEGASFVPIMNGYGTPKYLNKLADYHFGITEQKNKGNE